MYATTLLRPALAAVLAGGLALAPAAASTADSRATGTTTEPARTTSTTSAAADDGKLLLMLDASGSMKEKDPSGGTKMDAAKKALTGVVNELPAKTHVGLRVYGATEEGGKPTPAACADTQLAAPIKPLDKPRLTSAIKGFEAKGETPIAYSLEKGLEDLGSTGKRNIVLVSDGEESCEPDPCPVVKKLVKKGVDLRIDTVGFDVRGKAKKQLECLAETGGGEYYDAANADELDTRLSKLSQRAARPFQFSGRRVSGVDVRDEEQPPKRLPTLAPGNSTDTLAESEDTWRAYRVERTQKESTLHVSAATKPTDYAAGGEEGRFEELEMEILAPDGTTCSNTFSLESDHLGFRPIVTVAGQVLGQPLEPDADDAACHGRGTFTVLVKRTGPQPKAATGIQVIEEPRVTNVDELPAAVEGYPEDKELPADKPKKASGGLTFSDAPEVTDGSWVDTFVPGETLVYRVKVEDGQTARFTANGPTGGFRFPADSGVLDNLWVDGTIFAPDRHPVGSGVDIPGSFNPTSGSDPKSGSTAPLRYKNRYAESVPGGPDNLAGSSMSGWYYYVVSVSEDDLGEDLAGQPIKVQFTVDVEGKPSNAVEYDAAADSTWNPAEPDEKKASDTTSEEQGASSLLPWLGGGLLAVLVLAAAAWFAIRRLLAS